MAITLASDALSDAEITDGIGRGDLASAARLWVRHWQTALTAARRYVGPDEVPGLAAEALIATVSAIAIGRGPREDVSGFVSEAVRELGEDDEPPAPGPEHPAVFVSPMMTTAFAELDPELQDVLRSSVAAGHLDEDGVRALTVLQHYYLAEHTDRAETPACRRAHIAMMTVADSSTTDGVPGGTWLHLSTCAWCTEAFHEIAFSNVALDALVAPTVMAAAVAAPAPAPAPAAEPVEPAEPFVEPVYLTPEEPLLVDARPVPEEDDDEPAALVAAHAGRTRGRLIAVGIAAAAAASVVAVILVGQGSDPTPTAADTKTSGSTPTDVADTGTPTPSDFTTVAGPVLTKQATPTRTAAKPQPAQQTTGAAPSSTPTHSPSPTSAPTTPRTSPTPTPTPSPTPTSTPTRCNALQHLFGRC